MEPPEREARFDRLRGEGWEDEYRSYRQNWTDYPDRQFVAEYPLLVDLELSTLCNLRCPMCYTITDDFKKKVKPGLMEFDLFARIINEIAGKVPAIRLSLRGEPTIHPRFLDCLKYAKQKGVREVSTLTNGSKLSPSFIEKMIQAGLDWITISVDGLDDMYESIRKPMKFQALLQSIKDIKRIKDDKKATKPVVKIQAIWPSIKRDPEKFYNTLSPLVDLIAFNPLIDYLGNDSKISYEDGFSCCQLYQRLVVGADGRVIICSNDEESSVVIGDANQDSIQKIWHGSSISKLRALHRQEDGFLQVAVCRKCYLPRLTEDGETAQVNGRRFTIKNYVNRKQDIGQ